jgi:hypothetical protein
MCDDVWLIFSSVSVKKSHPPCAGTETVKVLVLGLEDLPNAIVPRSAGIKERDLLGPSATLSAGRAIPVWPLTCRARSEP